MNYATGPLSYQVIEIAHFVNKKRSRVWVCAMHAWSHSLYHKYRVYAYVVRLFYNTKTTTKKVNAAADNRYSPNKSERNIVLMANNLCSFEMKWKKKKWKEKQLKLKQNALTIIAKATACVELGDVFWSIARNLIIITRARASRKFHVGCCRLLRDSDDAGRSNEILFLERFGSKLSFSFGIWMKWFGCCVCFFFVFISLVSICAHVAYVIIVCAPCVWFHRIAISRWSATR